jgi:predicted aldo/keto reductase-like oxidoreductase
MQYRKFGKLRWKVSALGFGAMRLPQLGPDFASPVNEPESIKLMRYAFDHGVNYVDTAFPYAAGNSERTVGKALLDGYRKKVRLATKLSSVVKSPDEFDRYLDGQLKRLQTDKIDNYLLHGLERQWWARLRDWKALDWIETKIKQGKIGCVGFSFHDSFDVFKEIIDYYDNWTFCQVQYNYMDENNQAGRQGVEYAAGKGLAVVVMEPLRGGQLSKQQPDVIAKVWDSAKERSHVEWALDWLWNQPEISVVLSGMNAMQQVVDNVEYAGRSAPKMFGPAEDQLFKRIKDAYQSLASVPCTGCKYCQPCPNGVAIPRIFAIYNEYKILNDPHSALAYAGPVGLSLEQRANNCIECGECIEKCPQKIDIPEEFKKVHEALTKNQGPPPGPPPGLELKIDE